MPSRGAIRRLVQVPSDVRCVSNSDENRHTFAHIQKLNETCSPRVFLLISHLLDSWAALLLMLDLEATIEVFGRASACFCNVVIISLVPVTAFAI